MASPGVSGSVEDDEQPLDDDQPLAASQEGMWLSGMLDDYTTVSSHDLHSQDFASVDDESGFTGMPADIQPLAEHHDQPLAEHHGQPMRSCMQELECMKSLPEWQELWDAAKRLVLTPRYALAYHFTTACQPRKQMAPAGSLKDCGIEVPVEDSDPASGGGGVKIQLDIPHAFHNDDNLRIVYISPSCPSLEATQKHACLEMLCFLLSSGPNLVILHPHNFMNNQTSIDELRQ